MRGRTLVGDLDGDGRTDRASLRVDRRLPLRCRYLLVVDFPSGDSAVVVVKPVPWPGTDPRLRLLAQIDGREGLEAAVALSPAAVYKPGALYTIHQGALARMRRDVEPKLPDDVFPFADEFPAGVNCAGKPGTIVVTVANLADDGRDDRHWEITRSFYRAARTRFALIRTEGFRVEVGPTAQRRWPELRGEPFTTCPDRVD